MSNILVIMYLKTGPRDRVRDKMLATQHIESTNIHFLDEFSLLTLFLFTLLLQVLSIELGYYLATRPRVNAIKMQASQVRAIMGAGLGLLAFMLAFTFASSQDHYEMRVQTMVEEARLLRTAYLETDLLSDPFRQQARSLLQEYVADRLSGEKALREGNRAEVLGIIQKSELMQKQLWALAVEQHRSRTLMGALNESNDQFQTAVLGLIDVHVARIEAIALNRIPNILWIALYVMAVLSMLVMGYQAGLVGRRSPVATVTLAIAFATVMTLITDLDRPVNTLFHLDNQVMVNLARQINDDDP